MGLTYGETKHMTRVEILNPTEPLEFHVWVDISHSINKQVRLGCLQKLLNSYQHEFLYLNPQLNPNRPKIFMFKIDINVTKNWVGLELWIRRKYKGSTQYLYYICAEIKDQIETKQLLI